MTRSTMAFVFFVATTSWALVRVRSVKMVKRIVAILALLSTQLACTARAESPVPETNATLSAAAAQSDFDLMQHALEEAHPGLYRYSTKAEMDGLFAAERKKLNHPM